MGGVILLCVVVVCGMYFEKIKNVCVNSKAQSVVPVTQQEAIRNESDLEDDVSSLWQRNGERNDGNAEPSDDDVVSIWKQSQQCDNDTVEPMMPFQAGDKLNSQPPNEANIEPTENENNNERDANPQLLDNTFKWFTALVESNDEVVSVWERNQKSFDSVEEENGVESIWL